MTRSQRVPFFEVCGKLVGEDTGVPSSRLGKKMKASRVVWRSDKLPEEPLWGMEYGRFTTTNISKSNILHVKINKTYSHLVCPLLFLAISAILACFPYHCYSWTERVSSRNSVLRHRMRDAYMNKSFAFFSRREFGIPVVNVKDSLV